MQADQNIKGVVLMALGFFSFAACDALAKVLTTDFHPLQIVWMRMLGLFLGVCVLLAMRGPGLLRTPKPGLQILRGCVAVGSATLFIICLLYTSPSPRDGLLSRMPSSA